MHGIPSLTQKSAKILSLRLKTNPKNTTFKLLICVSFHSILKMPFKISIILEMLCAVNIIKTNRESIFLFIDTFQYSQTITYIFSMADLCNDRITYYKI